MVDLQKKLLQIKDCGLANSDVEISFEFFPAKKSDAQAAVKNTIEKLSPLNPSYFSVTYGAGGTTKDQTYELVKYIKENTNIPPAAHLTCVNATKEEINNIAQSYFDIGVNKIVALRGDMPGMVGEYEPFDGGYAYASDLVEGLHELGDFDVSVAAYPEVHPQAPSAEFDIDHLKRKIDAGANKAITQYCFDTDRVVDFIEKAAKAGISAPIVPGIMTMNGYRQLVSFSKRGGTDVPAWLSDIFEGMENNPQAQDMAATVIAFEQCKVLIDAGVKEFHFYTLNRPDISLAVCNLLGLGR